MTPGEKVSIKRIPGKVFTVAKVVRTRIGLAARLVDDDNVYVGQFYLNSLQRAE